MKRAIPTLIIVAACGDDYGGFHEIRVQGVTRINHHDDGKLWVEFDEGTFAIIGFEYLEDGKKLCASDASRQAQKS